MALKYTGTTLTTTAATLVGAVGQRFGIQPDVAVRVAVGGSTIVASATNGILVAAGGLYEDTVESEANQYVSVYAATAFNAMLFRAA